MISLNLYDRLVSKWNGTHFVEDKLVISGYNGITTAITDGAFVISGNQAAIDTAIAGKVSKAGDTMTGPLVLSGDPAEAMGAATRQFVLAQAAAAAVVVKEDGVDKNDSSRFLDFTHAIDVASGTTGVTVAVDEDEFDRSKVVMVSGNQDVYGVKTFNNTVIVNADLGVSGTIYNMNTVELYIEDSAIKLNANVTDTPTDGHFQVERGTAGADAELRFDESEQTWYFGLVGSQKKIASADDVAAASGALVTGYEAADTALSGALKSGYEAADTALSGALKSDYEAADTALSGALQEGLDTKVNRAGDIMEGNLAVSSGFNFLTAVSGVNTVGTAALPFEGMYADEMFAHNTPSTGDSLCNKTYVDQQVSSAAVAVYHDDTIENESAKFFNFKSGIDATISTSGVIVTVNEAELTGLVHKTGTETVGGQKTFTDTVVIAAGVEPQQTGAGSVGEIRWTDDYLYVCVAANDWRRTALSIYTLE